MRPLFLLLLFFSLAVPGADALTPPPPPVAEVEWGLWVGEKAGTFKPLWPQPTLCVHSSGVVELELRGASQHEGYRFEPQGNVHCRQVMGGLDLSVSAAVGEVRILVTRFPPRTMERPGLTVLPDFGEAVLVPAASPDSIVEVRGERARHVSAYTWPSLVPVPLEDGRVRGAGAATVVLMMEEGPGTGVLRWSDAEWHDRAPRLGSVLAVVALALLVALYRGPRDWASTGAPIAGRD